jgi:hypothetical protein
MADKLPPGHGIKSHKDKMGKVMHEWKHGTLHSGTGKKGKKGPKVTSREQAIAIGISESKHAETLRGLGYSEEAANAVAELYDFISAKDSAEDADEGPTSDVDSTPGKQKPLRTTKQESQGSVQTFPTLPKQAPGNNDFDEGPMIRARKGKCPTGTRAVGGGFCRNPEPGKRQYFEIEKGKGCPPGSRSAGKGRCRVNFAESTGVENAVKAINSTPCEKKKKDPTAPKAEVAKPTTPTGPTEPEKPVTPERQMVRDAAKERADQCAKQTGN